MHTVCTIGYEAATMPALLEALNAADVQLLVDVRAVANSRRPGFAKTRLAEHLKTAGIEYLHLRALGTPPDGRAAARAGRHDALRDIYAEHLATAEAEVALQTLTDLLRAGRRICLLCFEANPDHCHRSMVADALAAVMPLEIVHLAPARG
jgi:uncharacterized protein (DUF488 family)